MEKPTYAELELQLAKMTEEKTKYKSRCEQTMLIVNKWFEGNDKEVLLSLLTGEHRAAYYGA